MYEPLLAGAYVKVAPLVLYAELLILIPFINIFTLLFAEGVWPNVKDVCPTVALNSSATSLTSAGATHVGAAAPLDVSTCPLVPAAVTAAAVVEVP